MHRVGVRLIYVWLITRNSRYMCATESLCYYIFLDSEQFMWPNIEEILLTMFLFCYCLSVNAALLYVLVCLSTMVLMFVAYF